MIQVTNKVFSFFSPEEILSDTNTLPMSTSSKKIGFLWRWNSCFSVSVSPNVIISLPISICEAKKKSCFQKLDGWKPFYHLPARINLMCMRIYIFCFKKTQTKTKKISLANLFIRIYIFSLQTIKDRAICFSVKKSAVRVAFFKCKLYLKNSIKLIIFFLLSHRWRFISSPEFPETRVLFFLAWQ